MKQEIEVPQTMGWNPWHKAECLRPLTHKKVMPASRHYILNLWRIPDGNALTQHKFCRSAKKYLLQKNSRISIQIKIYASITLVTYYFPNLAVGALVSHDQKTNMRLYRYSINPAAVFQKHFGDRFCWLWHFIPQQILGLVTYDGISPRLMDNSGKVRRFVLNWRNWSHMNARTGTARNF